MNGAVPGGSPRRYDVDAEASVVSVSGTAISGPNGEPRYLISVVAARCGVHPRTVRQYEREGLIRPSTAPNGLRLYTEADIDRITRIRRLTSDLGVNLAGVEAILLMREQILSLRTELEELRRRFGAM